MDDVLGILYDEHDAKKIVSACNMLIREIKNHQSQWTTDHVEVLENCFFKVFLSNTKNLQVLTCIIETLIEFLNLFQDVKKSLSKKGIFLNINQLVQNFSSDKEEQIEYLKLGYRLSIALTEGCPEALKEFCNTGIVQSILNSLSIYSYVKELLILCLQQISILISIDTDASSDNELIQIKRSWCKELFENCLLDQSASFILNLLNRYPCDSEHLHLFGLKCLKSFATLDGGIEQFCELGGLDTICHILYIHFDNLPIMQESFTLLKSFLQKIEFNFIAYKSNDICEVFVKVLSSSTKNAKKLGIISETLMTFLMIGSDLGLVVIKNKLHRLLFNALDYMRCYHSFAYPSDLSEDVCLKLSRCLFLLLANANDDVRNDILLDACRSGDADLALFALALGANINCRSTDGSHPLSIACKNEDENLVKQLLTLMSTFRFVGIAQSRVDSLQSSLQLSLQKHNSPIIAALLWYLFNRDMNGIAEWSRCSLSRLKCEWLETAFAIQECNEVDDEAKHDLDLEILFHTKWYQLGTAVLDAFSSLDSNKPEDEETMSILKDKFTTFDSSKKCPLHHIMHLQENSASFPTLSRHSAETMEYALEYKCTRCRGYLAFREFLRLSFDEESLLEERIHCTPVEICTCPVLFPPVHICSVDVKELQLSRNDLTSLDTFLNLSLNTKRRLSRSVIKIILLHNKLTEVPSGFAQMFKSVVDLNLSRNQLLSFPFELLLYCPSLEELDLSDNLIQSISTFPHERAKFEISNFKSANRTQWFQHGLKTLKLSTNAISDFPMWIFQVLPRLSRLEMQKNLLKTIADGGRLTDMASKIKDFLLHLTHVDLSQNNIHTVTASLLRLARNLRHIDLSRNYINEISLDSGSDLQESKLSFVYISDNQLSEIPRFVYFLPRLKVLVLSKNRISNLPIITASWKSKILTHFDLSHNNLLDIHPLVSMLVQYWPATLKKLVLSHNAITDIPPLLGKLHALEILDVAGNRIKFLPKELGRLSNLTSFLFQNNPLAMEEAIEKGTAQQVVQFLYGLLKKSVPNDRVKLILVGNPRAGKTTLLNSLMKHKRSRKLSESLIDAISGNDFENKSNVATVGVNVVEFTLTQDSRSFLLSVWDFAGQEDFYATHPCFISERAMYIAMYDASKGPDQLQTLKPWLSAIHARAEHCPVFIVGSHADSLPRKKTFTASLNPQLQAMAEKKWFPQGAFLSGSLLHELFDVRKNSSDIPILKAKIVNIILESKVNGFPLVGNMVPNSYVLLSKLLKQEADRRRGFPVISFNELVALLQNQNNRLCPHFDSSSELMLAVKYLHQTGHLLHFDDSRSRLNDYFFIQPDWLCKLFAQIVTMEENKVYKVNPYINKQGILSKTCFAENLILQKLYKNDLPSEFIPRLFLLLENFEIMLYQGGDFYLVPSRLPVQRPKIYLPVRNPSEKIVRYFSMAYAPMGLWPRLIARLLAFSGKLLHGYTGAICEPSNIQMWRDGVYFEWRNKDEKPYPFVLIQSGFTEPVSPYLGSEQFIPHFTDGSDVHAILQKDEKSTIELVVPRTQSGVILVSQLVDHILELVEEWYSGLLRPDKHGRCLFQQYAPCFICHDCSNSVHFFCIDELAESVLSNVNLTSIHEKKPYEIIISSSNVFLVLCPNHSHTPVPLIFLAPEINLDDFDSSLRLDPSLLSFEDSSRYLLGGGGFGAVYHATYNGEDVAIKTFHKTPDVSYRMLRAELNVLAQYQHPSIVSLKGFIPPAFSSPNLPLPLLAMEHAKFGSLGKLLSRMAVMAVDARKAAISAFMKHRIAYEIADGLCFLHRQNIIYRDLKPDNILLMSIDSSDPVVAKITDYGISTLASPSGTSGASGSPGYKAPEVIGVKTQGRQQELFPYSIKCDIYSYGLVLHELAVGRSPWIDYVYEENCSEKNTNSSIAHPDDVVQTGILPSPISSYKGASSWPYAQELVTNCLKRNPEERPSAEQIVSYLSTSESCCFRSLVSLLSSDPVFPRTYKLKNNTLFRCLSYTEDIRHKNTSTNRNSSVRMFYSSSSFYTEDDNPNSSNVNQLTLDLEKDRVISDDVYISLDDNMSVSCMIQLFQLDSVGETDAKPTLARSLSTKAGVCKEPMIVAGTAEGHVIVVCSGLCHLKYKSDHRVTCIHLYRHANKKSHLAAETFVIIALANRSLLLFTLQQIQNNCDKQPCHVISLDEVTDEEPSFVDSIPPTLYVVCGKKVVWISVADSGAPMVTGATEVNAPVVNFGTGVSRFYLNTRDSEEIQAWKPGRIQPKKIIYVSGAFRGTGDEAPTVTSLFVDVNHSALWVGTNIGRVAIYSESRYEALVVVHRHIGPIRRIFAIEDSIDAIACLGEGFRPVVLDSRPQHINKRSSRLDSTSSSFYLTIWDPDLPNHEFLFDSILKARKAYQK